MFHPTISPHDTKEALVACDMTGAYITHDGGHSWRMFNLRGPVRFFVFDPVEPHTIYAATEGLWRSTDDGASWKLLWPQPSAIRGIRMSSDHADETIVADPNPMGQVVALAVDPADPKTLIAGATKNGSSAVFLSEDSGSTWTKVQDLEEAPQKIWIVPNSDKSNRDLYIAGKKSVTVRYRSKWQDRPGPKGVAFNDVSAGFSAKRGVMLYASSETGIFLSKDGGTSWVPAALPGSGAKFR
ncbi:MAG TPA: hypothetical protein VFE22_02515, partial [Edaphobacter sp.]|nr:hypothetical protein [Edaphobacter sp.]